MAERKKKLTLNIQGVKKIALSDYIAEKMGEIPQYIYSLLVKIKWIFDRLEA